MDKMFIENKVSVIIPCRNEEDFISTCLDSFVNQTYSQELLEILVCDGMSTDNTRKIVSEYVKTYKNIKLVNNTGLTAPTGMNTGIRYSNAEFIIIFGAHAFADSDFVKNNIEEFKNKDIGCTGGIMETVNDCDKGKAIAYAMSSPFGVGNALFRYAKEKMYVDTVAFGAYRRELLEQVGYFDEELVRNQDDELNFRITKAGSKILLSPKVKSVYYSRSSFKKLWNQYFQYGFWKVRVMQKHGRTAAVRHLVPMLFVLTNILAFSVGLINMFVFRVWILEISTYLLGNLIFAFKCSNKEYKLVPYIIASFIILHVSYGIGFINGLFSFYVLKSNKTLEKNTKMSR